MPDGSKWRNRYGDWRWPLFVVVWGSVALVVIVGGITYASWWETHQTERGRGDSPITGVMQDDPQGIVSIEMPDDFSGFATRCVWEGYRGFSTTNDGGAAVVPDPDCHMPEITPRTEVHR